MGAAPIVDPRCLRRVVLVVAGLNLAYAVVEASVAPALGSGSLLAGAVVEAFDPVAPEVTAWTHPQP